MARIDRPRIDLARALGELARRSAPGKPDFSRVYPSPAEGKTRRFPRAESHGARIAARIALPAVAAAACVAALILLQPRPRLPGLEAEGLALRQADYRLAEARELAAVALGLDGSSALPGVEADLLAYIEYLWSGCDLVPEEKEASAGGT